MIGETISHYRILVKLDEHGIEAVSKSRNKQPARLFPRVAGQRWNYEMRW